MRDQSLSACILVTFCPIFMSLVIPAVQLFQGKVQGGYVLSGRR